MSWAHGVILIDEAMQLTNESVAACCTKSVQLTQSLQSGLCNLRRTVLRQPRMLIVSCGPAGERRKKCREWGAWQVSLKGEWVLSSTISQGS